MSSTRSPAPAGGIETIESRLNDRVTIVTGGASGIGRHYCEALAGEGARVVVADLDGDLAVEVADAINADRDGPRALGIRVDATVEDEVAAMVDRTVSTFGTVDVLVNNVGTYPHESFEDITYESWRKVVTVNLDSVFLCTKAVLPTMKAQESGKIVNVATNLVWMGLAGMVHYVSAKAGILGFTRSLAREVGDFGITVNAIAPGAVAPPAFLLDADSLERLESIVSHQAVKWCQRPADLIGPLLFLVSDDSDFMSGQILTVDGGLTNH
jgi:NAD(P)-dependent dehydrogenase (short-subunit alcohol dehydrogenase family)